MRLIDGDALENAIDKRRQLLVEREMFGAEHVIVHHARRLVEEAPTVDAIPVTWLESMLDKTATQDVELNNAIFCVLVAWEREKQREDT